MNNALLGPTGRSADCQWSRHILCLDPENCECRCHVNDYADLQHDPFDDDNSPEAQSEN